MSIMRNATIKIYRFEELSEEAKENAIKKFHDVNIYDGWWESTYDHFKESIIGPYFEVTEIYFSGFWSQGDGAMFEYSDITEKLIDEAVDHVLSINKQPNYKIEAVKKAIYWSASGKQSGRYYHENSVSHSISLETNNPDHEAIQEYIELYHEDIEQYIIEKYKNLAQDLYRALENEYEYQTSEEQITEAIIANEYEFTEDGELF